MKEARSARSWSRCRCDSVRPGADPRVPHCHFFCSCFSRCLQPVAGSALARLQQAVFRSYSVLAEGKPKHLLVLRHTCFKSRASLKVIGHHPDTPVRASEEGDIPSCGSLWWMLDPQGRPNICLSLWVLKN